MTYIVDGNAVQVVAVETWEYISRNVDSYNFTTNKDVDGNITSIVYTKGSSTVTKTFSYNVNGDISSITLSGDLPVSLTVFTKTFVYTNNEITGANYS